MASGGGGQETTQQINQQPWGPFAQHIQQGMQQAQKLYNKGYGPTPFEAPGYAPFSQDQLTGMDMWRNTATQESPLLANAFGSFNQNMQNGGISQPMQQNAIDPLNRVTSGQMNVDPSLYGAIYGQAMGQPTSAQQNLGGMARGDLLGSNPHLMGVLGRGADEIALRSNLSSSAAGRYGSAGAARGTADALGGYYGTALSNNYENEMGRMMGANSQIDAARQAQFQTGLGAASGVAGAQGANANMLMGAAGSLGNMYNQGAGRSMDAARLSPMLDQWRYQPSQNLMQLGATQQAMTQQQINDAKARHYEAGNWQWDQLNRYMNVAGMGGQVQGGSQTTQQPGQSFLQGALGGGLAGAGLMGATGQAANPFGWMMPLGGAVLGGASTW